MISDLPTTETLPVTFFFNFFKDFIIFFLFLEREEGREK